LEVEPLLAVELGAADVAGGGDVVHPPAGQGGVDEGVEADLGEHAWLLGRRGSVHLVEDPGGKVVSLDLAVLDHLPDQRWVGTGGA
jgi:hypothetical protein